MDGCTNYAVLSEADRAQGNTQPSYDRNDWGLVTGWYRFQGAAGDRMADKCVLMYRCGTRYPAWLNGTHPTVAEGVVTRTVCFSRWGSCCYPSKIIKMKNCNGYYVYELHRTISLFPFNHDYHWLSRYCGNAGAGKLHLSNVSIANLSN